MTKQELQTKLNYAASCMRIMNVVIASTIDINDRRIMNDEVLISPGDVLAHLIDELNSKEELTEEEAYDLEAACLLLTDNVLLPEKILNAKLVDTDKQYEGE